MDCLDELSSGTRPKHSELHNLEIQELINGSALRDPLLVDHAADGDHSESAVHNLINLIFLESSGVLTQTQGVEAKVSWLALPFDGLLESVAAKSLEDGDEENDLAHAAGSDEIVVGVDREHVGEVGTGECPELLDHHAKGGEHADATVLDFGGLEEADVDVVGDEKRVELEGGWEPFEVLRLEQERNTLAHLHGGAGHRRPVDGGGAGRKRGAGEAGGGDRENGGESKHFELG